MYLDRIIARHREVAAADERSLGELVRAADGMAPARDFAAALRVESARRLAVIAEIKRRSPSKGALNLGLDAGEMAETYTSAGAAALSVLTDAEHFGGSVEDLQAARAAVPIPVLRKDFTVDLRDVADARLMGADCVLLIAAALARDELIAMHRLADDLGLAVLVEVHDEPELEIAAAAGASIVGINQRDLVTFQVDHERAVRMATLIPEGVIKVAESGVRGGPDAASLRAAGYDAVLVGESLVTAGDPARALAELRVG
jgi:indole-3-glycerol phosphate synthase